jgi:ketosteroid isomerase-like protein
VHEAENTQVVQDAYAVFGRGDIATLLGYMTDDIHWRPVIGTATHVPFSGERHGKPSVAEFFKQVSAAHDRRQRRWTATSDASEICCPAVQYLAHGSVRRRLKRRGTVVNVHRSGGALRSFQSSGMDTIAPSRARGEKAQSARSPR